MKLYKRQIQVRAVDCDMHFGTQTKILQDWMDEGSDEEALFKHYKNVLREKEWWSYDVEILQRYVEVK